MLRIQSILPFYSFFKKNVFSHLLGIIGKRRGRQHVAGTVVVPSDEDSQTFQVNFASGESYKLRAANVKDRQVWVDRIRAVAHRHESAMARDHAPPIGKYLDLLDGLLEMDFLVSNSSAVMAFSSNTKIIIKV